MSDHRTHDAVDAFARRALAVSADLLANVTTQKVLADFPDLEGHGAAIRDCMADLLRSADVGGTIADAAAAHLATHPAQES